MCINKKMQHLLIFTAFIATSHAGLLSLSPEDFKQSGDIKIATIVHNAPSAVSHSTFTRIHNHHANPSQHIQSTQPNIASTTTQPAVLHHIPTVAVQPVYTTQQLHAIPAAIAKHESPAGQVVNSVATTATAVKGKTPIVESLTHTPAHLTFAARPVVYQMLPEIKPVRKINYDEVVPSPRHGTYIH
ncbi:uncharacterized protein LOC128862045 [Anastrepha ludens]|uniref:uncharacterized protein LOC128862045 n=1 Tax=Anastrepha ludens TaxID=28586 RepID=UPI0023AEE6F2|nr:uncharacterized protein LOC128862045 [Anastrepha ludens]